MPQVALYRHVLISRVELPLADQWDRYVDNATGKTAQVFFDTWRHGEKRGEWILVARSLPARKGTMPAECEPRRAIIHSAGMALCRQPSGNAEGGRREMGSAESATQRCSVGGP